MSWLDATKKKEALLMNRDFLFLAPREGLEPTTLRLTVACSTIELPRNSVNRNIISADGLII